MKLLQSIAYCFLVLGTFAREPLFADEVPVPVPSEPAVESDDALTDALESDEPLPLPSEETQPAVTAEPAPPAPEPVETAQPSSEITLKTLRSVSLVGLMDVAYRTGYPIEQGFVLPAVRLGLQGQVGDHVGYRFSLGQTREYATVLLPQMLPVEAYVEWASEAVVSSERSGLFWRTGMFTPQLHPAWTPDIAEIRVADYATVHRKIFISRDLGTQLLYRIPSGRLEAAAGLFNGSGVFGLNTNQAKAFTGYLSAELLKFGDSVFRIGVGSYYLSQSTPISTNYKRNYLTDIFVTWESPSFSLSGEGFYGSFTDAVNSYYLQGGIGTAVVRFSSQWELFSRFEYLTHPPTNGIGTLQIFQVGPMLRLQEGFSLYLTYNMEQATNTTRVHSAEFRLRLLL